MSETLAQTKEATRDPAREALQREAYAASNARQRPSTNAPAAKLEAPRSKACVNCDYWASGVGIVAGEQRETSAWFPDDWQARTHAEILTSLGMFATWGKVTR